MGDLSNLIYSIQNIIRKDEGVDGDAQRIGQLSWMLFLKLFDAKEQEYELMKDNYESPIPEKLQWRNWAEDDEGITGETLINFVNNELFPELKNLKTSEDKPMSYIIRGVFEDSYNYMKSGTTMRQVINKLDEIDFNKKEEVHIFNDIYEKLLNDLQSAGNAGEFYTPRAITQFIVERVQPKLGDKIIDHACGTGGFLTGALEYIRKNDVKTAEDEELLQKNIYGAELKQLPHLLATTNLILHGIENPSNLKHKDSLAKPINDITDNDMYDIILMNPPFGGTIKDGIERNFPANLRSKETASLFMVLILETLKEGGKAGIIVPDSFLFEKGPEHNIREKLLNECNLHTIVRLPKTVFAPYAPNVSTNLLFFTKGEKTKEIRYYEHKIPKGQKSYSKTKPIKYEEFNKEAQRRDNRIEGDVSRKVSIDEIKDSNFNLDIKNPNENNRKQKTGNPIEYITKIDNNLSNAKQILNQLTNYINGLGKKEN